MKIEVDKLVFSTGKEVYANGGIVGLSPDGSVSEGYDGGVFDSNWKEWSGEPGLTESECVELADYMILRWADFRAHHKEAGG